jgi:type VI secretion system secreted protein Hcp
MPLIFFKKHTEVIMPIYMQIPDIEGSVSARGHENWIELNHFDYALGRHITAEPGRIADRESTSPSFGEISVRKKIDKSTPYIFSSASAGKSQGTVMIHACYTSDDLTPYLEFELHDVILSNYMLLSAALPSSIIIFFMKT